MKFRCALCGYMYSRKDTLKDHIRGKHNIGLAGELNRLVQIFVPQDERATKEGKPRKNKNVEQKTVPISSNQRNDTFKM